MIGAIIVVISSNFAWWLSYEHKQDHVKTQIEIWSKIFKNHFRQFRSVEEIRTKSGHLPAVLRVELDNGNLLRISVRDSAERLVTEIPNATAKRSDLEGVPTIENKSLGSSNSIGPLKLKVKLVDGESITILTWLNSDQLNKNYWKEFGYGYLILILFMTLLWLIPFFLMRRQLQMLYSAQSEVKKLALEDPVTGLPNRRNFNQMLEHSIAYADRYDTKCAILLLDLDNFKNVNDTMGHTAGDKLLKHIAARIRKSLRGHEVVSRIGGDEFVILISPFLESSDLETVAQRVINTVSQPIDIDGVTLVPTTSIGISTYPTDANDPVELFAHADIALYKAKDIEKGTFYFFDEPMRTEVAQAKKTEISLRRALKEDELIVHYQPQVNLLTGKIYGFEALIRWNHPDHGLVGPGHFIQLADDRGLAKHVGNFVIDRVLNDRARFRSICGTLPKLSFNISPSHFKHPHFLQGIVETFKQFGVGLGEVTAEITEDCVVGRGSEKCHQIISEMQAAGLDVALDDFGTGYASLTHLRDLSVNELKLDKSFIQALLSSESNDAIVQSILDLANSIGIRVIAEGIETREHLYALLELDCEFGQGYYFSRPIAFEDACQMLNINQSSSTHFLDPANHLMTEAV